jgi:hypothetical protein
VRASEREQPALDRLLRMLGSRQMAQTLRDDGADGRKRVLDPMVQFLKDQLLQLVGRLALPGVDACRGKQTPRVNLGLREQKPQADVLFRDRRDAVLRCLRNAGRFGDRLQTSPIVSS